MEKNKKESWQSRIREANNPDRRIEIPATGNRVPDPGIKISPDPTHYIEAGGLRIQLCPSCLRRFLGI